MRYETKPALEQADCGDDGGIELADPDAPAQFLVRWRLLPSSVVCVGLEGASKEHDAVADAAAAAAAAAAVPSGGGASGGAGHLKGRAGQGSRSLRIVC